MGILARKNEKGSDSLGGWRGFVNWILGGKRTDRDVYELSIGDDAGSRTAALHIKMLVMRSAIGYLASGLSLCEWRIFEENVERHNAEYFRLNNHPNCNQNKFQFCLQYVTNLMLSNEVLVVSPLPGDQSLYIADSFHREPHGLRPDEFTNIVIDGWDKVYRTTSENAMYTCAHCGDGLWPLLNEIAGEYEEIIATAYGGYRTQAGEKGILSVANVQAGTSGQAEAESNRLKNMFKSYFENPNAVIPLHSGYSYQATARSHRNTSEVNDMINLTDEFSERVALATRVPSALLKGNVENTEHAMEDLISYGVKPIAEGFQQEYNAKRIGLDNLRMGSRLFIDPIRQLLTTPSAVADYCTKMTENGQCSVDELRAVRQESRLNTEEATQHHTAAKGTFSKISQ